jgi:acyl dehydratase
MNKVHHLEDLVVGQKFGSAEKVVDEGEVRAFAKAFDPQPFHLDCVAAANSVFGGLTTSGWHTGAMTMRLLVDSELRIAGGFLGMVSTNFAGCAPFGPATHCMSNPRLSRSNLRRRNRLKGSPSLELRLQSGQ